MVLVCFSFFEEEVMTVNEEMTQKGVKGTRILSPVFRVVLDLLSQLAVRISWSKYLLLVSWFFLIDYY